MALTDAVCTPAEASFIRDVALASRDDLHIIAEKIYSSLNAFPQDDALFRQELCLLARMLSDKNSTPIGVDFAENLTTYIDTDIDDEEANLFCYTRVLSVGADKNESLHERMIGRLLAINSYNRIATYSYTIIQPYANIESAKNLTRYLSNFAPACKWTRKNDAYLHQMGRMLLPADQVALLHIEGETSNPLKRLSNYYSPGSLTDLLAPIIDTPPGIRVTSIDWEKSTSINDFIFAVSILQEMVDQDDLYLLTGPHITFHEKMSKPHLFLVSGNFTVSARGFGLLDSCSMTVVDTTIPFCIPLTLMEIIQRRSDNNSYTHLLECCQNPEVVSATNPFSQLLD